MFCPILKKECEKNNCMMYFETHDNCAIHILAQEMINLNSNVRNIK